MSRPICYDLINKIFQEIGIRKARKSVIDELDSIIKKADNYCLYNEDEWDEEFRNWEDLKMGNDEWAYSFWEQLEDQSS